MADQVQIDPAGARLPDRGGPMTDLRREVVRKVASSMCADRHNPSREGRYCGACVWDSARALDAFLDALATRADEWWVEAAEGRAVDCRVEHWVVEPEGLIAVVREGDE